MYKRQAPGLADPEFRTVFGCGREPAVRTARRKRAGCAPSVSYTHLRAHVTVLELVWRLLLEKKNTNTHKHTQHETHTQQ